MTNQLETPYSDPVEKNKRVAPAHSNSYYEEVAADKFAIDPRRGDGFEIWDEIIDPATTATEAILDELSAVVELGIT